MTTCPFPSPILRGYLPLSHGSSVRTQPVGAVQASPRGCARRRSARSDGRSARAHGHGGIERRRCGHSCDVASSRSVRFIYSRGRRSRRFPDGRAAARQSRSRCFARSVSRRRTLRPRCGRVLPASSGCATRTSCGAHSLRRATAWAAPVHAGPYKARRRGAWGGARRRRRLLAIEPGVPHGALERRVRFSLRPVVVCSICLASRAVGSDAELAADVDATVVAALWRASEEHGHRPFCLAVDGAVPVTPGGLPRRCRSILTSASSTELSSAGIGARPRVF